MPFSQVKINDQGACQGSKTSMEVLWQYRNEEYGEGHGKVSVAEMRDGTLVIALTTIYSPQTDHFRILSFQELSQSLQQGGAFYVIDWHTGTVQLKGISKSLGPIPDNLKDTVTVELQELLDHFLKTLPK